MAVKITNVSIIHIIQPALLGVHMRLNKARINNIVDKSIVDLVCHSAGLKKRLHIGKITNSDDRAVSNGNTFGPGHSGVHSHDFFSTVHSDLLILKFF
jgi:hypothetical protein